MIEARKEISPQEVSAIIPGVYDITNDEYHNSPGISRSGIMLMKKSPKHYWSKYLDPNQIPDERTAAKEFGAAFHPYILEPHLFSRDFAFEDKKIDGRTAEGKKYRAEFALANAGKKTLTQAEYMQLLGMSQSINNDPIAVKLLKGAQYEKSIYWIDDDTGVLCKCRPDIWRTNMFCDIKSSKDASPYNFQYDLYRYGYHIQAAMMIDAARIVLQKKIDDFIIIAIEKTPPYAVAVYMLDQEAINKGREEYKSYLEEYKKCLDTNNWPGYRIKQISLPNFVYYLQE